MLKNSWINQPIKKCINVSLNSFYGNTFFSDSKTCLSRFESHIFFCTNHESDGSLLVDVDGDVGALDPGVGAQVSQSYVRVSGRQTAHFSFTSALFLSLCSSVEVQLCELIVSYGSLVSPVFTLCFFLYSNSQHQVSYII